MTDRATIARQAADALRRFTTRLSTTPVTVGLDGFVDSIIAVVDERCDADHYVPVPTIDAFGRKILAAAGMSSNYELVVKLQKLGGNGPIMANALATLGLPVTYIGMLGYPAIDPAFAELAKRARCLSVCDAGRTDALEFTDGKLMLGKYECVKELTWRRMEEVIGAETLRTTLGQSRLVSMVNWTMLPAMSDIWRTLVEEVLPELEAAERVSSGQPLNGRRQIFIDLADPEKRPRSDLREALDLVSRFQQYADVTLGVNLKEATQTGAVLGVTIPANPEAGIEAMARAMRERLNVAAVVIHPRKGAAAAVRQADGTTASATFAGPFVKEPRLSTGAGDHFNAGFCLGRLAGLDVVHCLCVGTATSGFYVREAKSPSLAELADFCAELPPGE